LYAGSSGGKKGARKKTGRGMGVNTKVIWMRKISRRKREKRKNIFWRSFRWILVGERRG